MATTKSAARALRKLGLLALDFIFPPLCSACRAPVGEAHHLCSACWARIAFLSEPLCSVCGFPFEYDAGPDTICAACRQRPPAFDKARALMQYDDASRDPILALKRADRLDLALSFAQWLDRAGREVLAEADLVIPVPLHRWRLWRRRYNQSALVAQTLGRRAGKPVDCRLLFRTRATPSQGDMPSARARRRNVQGAFGVDRLRAHVLLGKSVLLIDDVFTTGATIEACARALKRAGAARVLVLTLARVVRPLANPI
ncbi:MAG TPA: ComF family protein [Rhizomicrobium sp.]